MSGTADATSSVSIVICAYTLDRWLQLKDAVQSVEEQTADWQELIIVIDHNDELLAMACSEWRSHTVVPSSGAPGLSGARNTGVAAAKADVIAFLDDDAVAESDWLERLLEAYRDDATLGVGGRIVPAWVGEPPAWFPDEFNWVVGCSYRGLPEQGGPVRNLIGANMSIRGSVLRTIDGFREGLGRTRSLPMGCEETELCIRARHRWPQGSFIYEPHAVVHHRVPASRSSMSYFCARCFAEGLSKSAVASSVGSGDGLSSERAFALQTIPRGLNRELKAAVLTLDVDRLACAGALLSGLICTGAGYLLGTFNRSEILETFRRWTRRGGGAQRPTLAGQQSAP